jgi:hypothetical protein
MNKTELIARIKTHIEKGDQAAEKSEQHYVTAGLHLIDLKAQHKGNWQDWQTLLKTKVGIGKSRASELMQIADGRKTVEAVRGRKAQSMRKSRENDVSPPRGGEPPATDVKEVAPSKKQPKGATLEIVFGPGDDHDHYGVKGTNIFGRSKQSDVVVLLQLKEAGYSDDTRVVVRSSPELGVMTIGEMMAAQRALHPSLPEVVAGDDHREHVRAMRNAHRADRRRLRLEEKRGKPSAGGEVLDASPAIDTMPEGSSEAEPEQEQPDDKELQELFDLFKHNHAAATKKVTEQVAEMSDDDREELRAKGEEHRAKSDFFVTLSGALGVKADPTPSAREQQARAMQSLPGTIGPMLGEPSPEESVSELQRLLGEAEVKVNDLKDLVAQLMAEIEEKNVEIAMLKKGKPLTPPKGKSKRAEPTAEPEPEAKPELEAKPESESETPTPSKGIEVDTDWRQVSEEILEAAIPGTGDCHQISPGMSVGGKVVSYQVKRLLAKPDSKGRVVRCLSGAPRTIAAAKALAEADRANGRAEAAVAD